MVLKFVKRGMAPKLLLASQSPRRRELLKQIGVKFSVSIQDIDESRLIDEKPTDLVKRLAEQKASACLDNARDINSVVLASDTIVVLGEEVFGKPEGKFDAVRMLLRLSDRRHRVLTAVSVMCHDKSKTICSETAVTFRAITTDEAEDSDVDDKELFWCYWTEHLLCPPRPKRRRTDSGDCICID